MTPHRIMIVEDERIVALNLAIGLRELGYDVVAVESSGEEAVARAREILPDLVLMDIVLDGEMDGIDAASAIRSNPGIPVIYLTAYSDETFLTRARKTAPAGYLVKPVDAKSVHAAIQTGLYVSEFEKRLKQNEARYRAFVETQVQLLCRYWPGTMQELKSMLERVLIAHVNKGPALSPATTKAGKKTKAALNISYSGKTLREVTKQLTLSMCLDALERCKGNKREAAKSLGISRDALYRYLKELGVLPKDEQLHT